MGSVKKSSFFTLPFWRIGKTVQNEQTEPAGGTRRRMRYAER